ncbi:MAG: hypothetical protein ABI700_30940 [Chloroflexota bacterium]
MIQLNPLIEAVKQQMQPESRAQHLAGMLQELFVYTPDEATLADLVIGWQALTRPQSPNEAPSIAHRRQVYSHLAVVAARLTPERGNLTNAVKTWQAWTDAFQKSADPRNAAMAKTLARELAELQGLA